MTCVPSTRNAGSRMDKSERNRSKAIDRILAKDKQVLKSQVQLLLLGTPQAGKTTLVKQLRVRSGETFSQEEIETSKLDLLDNLADAMRVLLTTREEMVYPWNNEVAEDDALAIRFRPVSRLLSELGWKGVTSMFVRLWNEEGVRKAWQQLSGSGVHGMECLPMFLEDPLRLCDQEFVRNTKDHDTFIYQLASGLRSDCSKYCPSTKDMICIYRSTRGVTDYSVKGETSFRLVEMGGRSLTTPKLLYFFDNVNAVIFVASCSEVERKFSNGTFTSGFHDTCEFFCLVAKDKSLLRLPIILIITKLDVLLDKAKRMDLKTVLTGFKGNPQDAKDLKKHLVDVFRSHCGARTLYYHFMNCTDLHSVQEVFVEIKRDIRDSLLRRLLPQ